MKQFLRYIFAVTAMLMVVVGDAWGQCYYGIDNSVTEINTNKHSEKEWWGTNTYYKFASTTEIGSVNNTYGISKITATITLERTNGGKNAKVKLEYSVNGGPWISLGDEKELAGTKVAWETDNKLEVSQNVDIPAGNTVKFRICETKQEEYGGSRKLTISNFNVTIASTMTAIPSSLDFGVINYGGSKPEKDFKVSFSNVGNNISATSNSQHFSVSPSSEAIDCFGEKTFTVIYNPQSAGVHQGGITITSTTGKSTYVSVNGTAKGKPEHTWKGQTEYWVDETINLSSLWETSNTENTPSYAIEKFVAEDETGVDPVLNGTSIKLTRAGKLTVKIIQDASEIYSELSTPQQITIKKRTADFAWMLLEESYHVDDWGELVNIYSVTDNTDGADVLDELHNTIAFASKNPEVVSVKQNAEGVWGVFAANAGTATVTATYAGNYKWNAFTAELPLTIIKYTPEFIWKDLSIHYDRTISNYFTTTSPNELTYSSSNEQVAILSQASSQALNLKIYNTAGSTKLIVSQAEDRKWYSKTEERTITPTDPNDHVPFTIDTDAKRDIFVSNYEAPGYSWNNGIQLGDAGDGFNYNDKYVDIKFSGYPDKLTFSTSIVEAGIFQATDIYWYVKESVDGMTWSDVVWSEENTKQVSLEKPIQLKPETQYIRLCYSGNFGGVFHNIKVTELKQFSAEDQLDGDKHLDFGANQVQSTKTVKFDLKYANVGYKISAASNNNRFKVTPAINTEIGGERYGTYEYSVSYTSDVLYETVGDESYIELTDELGNSDRIYLHASSYKASQNITWREDFAAVDEPAIRKSDGQIANAAKASSGLTVTYTSSDPSIIEVIDNGKVLLPKKAGRVKITASQAGNSDTWEAASNEEKWFIVTDKMLQYILWSDALTDLTEDDINTTKVLGAKVYVQVNAEGYEVEYSESQTGKIEYTSADNSIVSVEGNVLTINSTGQTTLTVIVDEDETYAAVSLVVPVIVKAKPVGCADELLLEHKDEVSFFAYNTNEVVQGPFAIDRDKGVPGTLEFQHYGASWDLGIQYYSGTIKAQYTTDDNSNWVDAKEVTPKEDQATTETGIALPRNATQIRFVRPSGGTGYHYVSNIQVHPAQYLETEDNVEEVNFGEILIGSTVTKSLNINYSNIKSEINLVLSSNELSTDPVVFGQCGAFGTQTLNISWRPSVASDAVEETLILRDELTGMVKEVKLTAIVIKGEQKITWSSPGTITTCLEFPEETDVHVAVEWEIVSGEDCASFEGNMLNIYKSGNIQVKGSAAESDNYKAYSIVYNFVVDYNPTYIGDDGNWNNPSNWNVCRVPNADEVVTIVADVKLITPSQFKGLNIEEDAVIHIRPTGGLTIGKEGIRGAKEGSIIIDNAPQGAGFLRVDPTTDNKPAKVTVNYTTRTYDNGSPRNEVWQYLGMPGANGKISSLEGVSMYYWQETSGWILKNATDLQTIPAWQGYAFTQSKKQNATFQITVEPILEDKEIHFTCTPSGMKGDNLFVNSYLSPIDVTKIDAYDIVDPDNKLIRTFFLFNSGSWNDWNAGAGDITASGYDKSSAGHYYSIPFFSSELINDGTTQVVIPPMQGVYVYSAGESSIKLDYNKHVLAANAKNMHNPMRAPQHKMQDESFRRVRIQASSENSGADRMYIVQEKNTTPGYDNGYDGDNILAANQVNIYTHESFGQMEVSCSNQIDSMYIGFTAGEDSEYTLTFGAVIGKDMVLKDLESNDSIVITDGEQYTFHAQPNSVNDMRFQLLLDPNLSNDTPNEDEVETAIDNTSAEAIRVWINNKKLYVADAPANTKLAIYTTTGICVTAPYAIQYTPYTLDLSYLPIGVYVVRLNNQAYKFVCE